LAEHWPSLGWDKVCVLLLARREREAAGREEGRGGGVVSSW